MQADRWTVACPTRSISKAVSNFSQLYVVRRAMPRECQCALGGCLAREIAVAYSCRDAGYAGTRGTGLPDFSCRKAQRERFSGKEGSSIYRLSALEDEKVEGCEVNGIPHIRGICQGRSMFVRFGLSPPIDHEEEGEQERRLLIGPMKLQILGVIQ